MLLLALTLILSALGLLAQSLSLDEVRLELGPQLSESARISENGQEFARWSEYYSPTPGVVVSVASEEDVAVTVCFEVSTLSLAYMSNLQS